MDPPPQRPLVPESSHLRLGAHEFDNNDGDDDDNTDDNEDVEDEDEPTAVVDVVEIAHRATATQLDTVATQSVAILSHDTGCGATMHTVSATHEATAVEQQTTWLKSKRGGMDVCVCTSARRRG